VVIGSTSVSGTTVLGTTVTGTTANFTSGNFTNISGGTHTITSGVFAAGNATNPSISFTSDPNSGLFSPGADQVAISTNGSGRLFIDTNGNVTFGVNGNTNIVAGQSITFARYTGTDLHSSWRTGNSSAGLALYQTVGVASGGDGTERIRAIISSVSGSYLKGLIWHDDSGNFNLAFNASQGRFEVGNTSIGTGTFTTVPASGTNVAGPNVVIAGGQSTGTGAGGSILFNTASAGGSGTSVNALTERARIDSSGRLLVGTSTGAAFTVSSTNVYTPYLQISGGGGATEDKSSIALVQYNTGGTGRCPGLFLGKSRSGSIAQGLVQNGEALGEISFQGSDGSNFIRAAQIRADVDGSPGTNDMPSRLVFSTTADGASSPTERVRITSNGYLKASNTGSYYSPTSAFHEVISSLDAATLIVQNSSASLTNSVNGVYVYYSGATPNNTNASAFYFEDTGGIRASIRSNGGLANYQANNVNFSDRSAKKNITVADDTWGCVKQWEIVKYHYKDQLDDADLNMGVIAQQVAESCPEVITVFQEAKEATEDAPAQEERLGVKEQQMMWMAIKALQEAQLRIETLEAEVAVLKAS
jgi:hypothetical protein